MLKNRSRGFTLIELLVVIAIIGILSAVVLASLNTARNKGSDAATKADIDSARAQAELYYGDNGNSYANVCTQNAPTGVAGIQAMVSGVGASSGAAAYCNSTATTWVLAGTLKGGGYYCSDNTGTSTSKSGTLPTSGGSC